MKTSLILTTIYKPNKNIITFSKQSKKLEWDFIVIGDKKTPNKEYNQNLLGLDPEYKHVLNIGLFTWGKNQGYAFEVARLLQDYKIKFHFVGNQASNFVDYWGPIMETKPDNCIVWGERNDVDSFTQSCDVHLFTSRLELNPLSIKESLEYSKPTMIFNLPTYKGKYNSEENIHYLTGDTIKDSQNLLNILGIKRKALYFFNYFL
jgi:hypothetical protein